MATKAIQINPACIQCKQLWEDKIRLETELEACHRQLAARAVSHEDIDQLKREWQIEKQALQAQITELKNIIIEKDKEIAELKQIIAKQGEIIKQQGERIKQQDEIIKQQGETIKQQGETIKQQGDRIEQLENSLHLIEFCQFAYVFRRSCIMYVMQMNIESIWDIFDAEPYEIEFKQLRKYVYTKGSRAMQIRFQNILSILQQYNVDRCIDRYTRRMCSSRRELCHPKLFNKSCNEVLVMINSHTDLDDAEKNMYCKVVNVAYIVKEL